jgi:hypothetical protein
MICDSMRGKRLWFVIGWETKGSDLWLDERQKVLICDSMRDKRFWFVIGWEANGSDLWLDERQNVLICEWMRDKRLWFVIGWDKNYLICDWMRDKRFWFVIGWETKESGLWLNDSNWTTNRFWRNLRRQGWRSELISCHHTCSRRMLDLCLMTTGIYQYLNPERWEHFFCSVLIFKFIFRL